MAKDTKYLSLIRNTWHFDYPVPKSFRKWFRMRRIRHSLNTSDLDQAIKIRDLYLRPVISCHSAEEILRQLQVYIGMVEKDLEHGIDNLKSFMHRKKREQTMTLAGMCGHFIGQNRRTSSPASLSKYNSAISAVCLILDGDTPAESITRKDVLNLRDTLLAAPVRWKKTGTLAAGRKTKTLSPNTVRGIIRLLRNIFEKAIEDEVLKIDSNPAAEIKLEKSEPMPKRPPEEKEVGRLCDMPMPRSAHFDRDAWHFLPILARYTGCRIGELALLNAEDVIVKNNVQCLRITAYGENKSLKTRSSERVVPVGDKLRPHLEKLLGRRHSGRLFPKCGDLHAKGGNIKRAHYFDKAYNKAAKKISEDLSFHCWRVYANTQMADAGIDILDREAILGHKSDRIQRFYTAENLKRYKKALDVIF